MWFFRNWDWSCLESRKQTCVILQQKIEWHKKEIQHLRYRIYVIIQALKHWEHDLIHQEFILHIDHEALKHLNGQQKLCKRHANYVSYLQRFTFVIKHKFGISNKVVDVLSWRSLLLTSMTITIKGFNSYKDLYLGDPFFGSI